MLFTDFVRFVAEINTSNSRNYKLEVLKKYKDNEAVKYCLEFLFNPYITTGVSTKKLAKKVPLDYEFVGEVQQLLEWLKTNNTGKDEAISKIAGCGSAMDEQPREVFGRLICKDLPLGVEAKTINKVMPRLVPTFNVMLANKYFDDPTAVEGKEFAITTKIDGGRIVAIKKDGEVKFYTRAGQLYEGLVDLEREMHDYMPDNIMLDGEISLLHNEGVDNKTNYKQTMMITRKQGEKHGVKMLVFDAMPADQFYAQKCTFTYSQRRHQILENAIFFNASQLQFFELLPILYRGTDTSMITEMMNAQIAKGEEGVMINICDAPYAFERTSSLLKVKKMQDVDLEVIRLEEGAGQNAAKLGAFVVEYKGFEVRVGSGISKEVREMVWANKEDYIGATISVQYFEETRNQQGGVSLRFPVFIDFRYDK